MRVLILFLFSTLYLSSQDSAYTRGVIKYLTSEKCFGRGYVNDGLTNASDYIVSELKKMGLSPYFNSSYTQNYNHPVNTFTKKIKLSVNGSALKPGIDFIVDPSSPTIKGKFSFVQKDSVTSICKQELITIGIKKVKKLTYSVGTSVISNPLIQILHTSVTDTIKNAKICIQNNFIANFKTNNIGAKIVGTVPDTLVVYTAHYDHLGGMGKGCYFPGANDNASGTSMVLNLAKYYSTHQPKYTMVFLFFSSEEAGLIGSKYFVENNSIDFKRIKFLINLDLMGTGDDGIMAVNGAIFEKQFQALQTINTENNLLKEVKKRGKAMNSDHYWFTEKGVPSFFLYTLGGVSYYHDVLDKEETLPLTKYKEVFQLLTLFTAQL